MDHGASFNAGRQQEESNLRGCLPRGKLFHGDDTRRGETARERGSSIQRETAVEGRRTRRNQRHVFMPTPLRKATVPLAIGIVVSVFLVSVNGRSRSQANPSRTPRFGGTDKPNLEGLWQALNTANYNIEAHEWGPGLETHTGVPGGPRVPAAAVLALGAIGGVPPGEGVVEGALPYQQWAVKQKQENLANALTRDP